MSSLKPLILLMLISLNFYTQVLHSTEIRAEVEAETQRQIWILRDKNIELTLTQLLPDQTRAFYLGRGFSAEITEQIATQCMMQTVLKNTATTPQSTAIHIDLKDWHVREAKPQVKAASEDRNADAELNTKLQPIKLKEVWDQEWQADEVTPAARLAFRWATFPTEQTFEPKGDYNWGMTSMGKAPGSRFDLNVVWYYGEQRKSAWIEGMMCAEDRQNNVETGK